MIWREQLNLILLAVSFLSRIPVGSKLSYSDELMNQSLRYYPLVGLLLGLILSLAFYLTSSYLPLNPSVILTIGTGLMITGAFHEDGFADLFDGIGGGQDIERSLAIMKDSLLGTYGVAALVVLLLLKTSLLIALVDSIDPYFFVASLITAQVLSRTSAVIVIRTSQYVRLDGKAKPIADAISQQTFSLLMLVTVICLLPIAFFYGLGFIFYACLGAAIGHGCMRLMFESKLKGYTGDCLGAVQQASEIGIFLVLLMHYS